MSEHSLVTPEFRARVRRAVVPIAVGLGRLGLTPDGLTIIGFLGTCLAAVAAAQLSLVAAGVLLLAFGIFDLFDGALARATGRVSAFGAFLDSTLDRLGENIAYVGIIVGCAGGGTFWLGAILAALAMATASVVTYTRARAEAVGLHGEVGIAPRPERLVVLSVGMIVAGATGGVATPIGLRPGDWVKLPGDIVLAIHGGQPWLALALGLIVLASAVTVVQRIVHVKRQAQTRAPANTPREE